LFYYRKIISTILITLVSMTYLFANPVLAKDTPPSIGGKYGIAIDAATGEVLYSKNADKQAYPASITKVLTAIVFDEKIKDNQMLTVSANAARQECVCFGLKAGEKISKKDAMYGMLLLSANDLAVTVAENASGTVQGFAQLLNEEAKKLGLKNTHFVTPNGLHDPDHYTTAQDMALIMKEALKHPEVLNALSTQSISVHTSLGNKIVTNTSQVHTQPASAHVIAGKNGYTDQAGHTLVEYLKDGDKEIIAVVMKTNKKNQYQDIQTMTNYAFAHMSTKVIVSKGEVVKKTRINGQKVNLIAPEDITVKLTSVNPSKLSTKIDLVTAAGKEIKKGQVVANLLVLKNGKIFKEVPLVSDKQIKKEADKIRSPKKSTVLLSIVIFLAGIFVLAVLFRMFMKSKRRKKREAMKKRYIS
jgi:D-alanyl-D-alanine carboxypeptidase